MTPQRRICVLFSAIAAGMLFPFTAFAGWISTQNDTKMTLAVQEVGPGRLPQRGKPVRLLPGEVSREFSPVPGEKRIQIWDPRQPGKLLFDGPVNYPNGDVTVRIVCEANKIKVVLEPVLPKK